MTQALQVCLIDECSPIPFVIPDMIHVSGRNALPSPSALPAERLSKKLPRPENLCPYRQAVPIMPGSGLPAASLFWLVLRAPAALRQFRTSWMPTWPKYFVCHGLSPPGKTKAPKPQRPLRDRHWLRRWRFGSGSGSRYLQYFSACTTCSRPQDF